MGIEASVIIRVMELKDGDGITFRNYCPITYKSGWQVATEGVTTRNRIEAGYAVLKFGGNCGVWYSEGVYYIDKSQRVNTKREAMEIGRAHNQISVLNWRTMGLAYC